ncbi:hypothetical protein CEQ90_12545 [Lewinellaceae bacterium SD302]|nr:hypothetical protein CEQ90_12545 [Lewinellaceae bacterium SD302]
MEILYGVLIVFAWFGIFLVMRLLTTFLHEMGHALPVLAFSDKPVEVFIGSYGEREGGFKPARLGARSDGVATFGRLTLFFNTKLLSWQAGMCRFESLGLSRRQMAIILFGGPVASVLVAGIGFWAIVNFRFGDVFFVIVSAFLLSSLWDLFINLLPASFGNNRMHGVGNLQTDGEQLLALWREGRRPAVYHELKTALENKDYGVVTERVEADVAARRLDPSVIPLAIAAYEARSEYGGALSIYEYLHKQQPLRPVDYFALGELYQKLNNYQEAINCYGEYLHEFYSDARALHARGWCYQQLTEHGAAIQEITTALRYNDQFAAAWRDRAYSLLRLNQFEDAISDLNVSRQLEPEHPRQYLYDSLYLEATGKYAEAYSALLKAKELGDEFHGIEFRLSELERRF